MNNLSKKWLVTALLIGLLIVAPFVLPEFRLNLLARFLTYAIVAIGLDLIWGYTGILSLGHGVYFGLGAYCTAMYLKLEATGGKMPDFMAWSGVDQMPWFWQPFRSPLFALIAAIVVPTILGALLGYAAFRNRIKGVFFSILSQALALVIVTLFVGQQGYTGGTNGMTNFKTFLGIDLNSKAATYGFYWLTVAVLVLVYFGCRALINGKIGKILIAIRDGENRARFIGYNPVAYQTFVYALSAALAGLAGMLFVFQEGLITPVKMDILMSVKMVLWVAIGGRATLIGAIVGAILVNTGENLLSERYPETWSYLLGITFLAAVLYLPRGVVGWAQDVTPRLALLKRGGLRGRSTIVSDAA
jgi:urea transport system permease protein